MGDPLTGHTAAVHAVTVLDGRSLLVSGSADGTVRAWRSRRADVRIDLASPVTGIAVGFPGQLVVAAELGIVSITLTR